MAFSAVETTRITLELATAFAESCPTLKQVFLDGSAAYAANQTDLDVITAVVTDALFNETAPTIAP